MEPLHVTEQQLMELFQVDDDGLLFVSPEILDWKPLAERKVKLVIDLEGEIDRDVPTVPNSMVYVYFPFDDSGLPDLVKLHALGRLAAEMVRNGRAVLIHCSMGFNRSPLMAGVTFTYLGMTGPQALAKLREKRAGALYNSVYADYLMTLPAHGTPV
jgi:protein-tyrosine phosphatase